MMTTLTASSRPASLSSPSPHVTVGPLTPGKYQKGVKRASHSRFFCAYRLRTSARMHLYGGGAGQALSWPGSFLTGSEKPRVSVSIPISHRGRRFPAIKKEIVMPKHSHGQNLPENLDLKSPSLKLAALETQAEDLAIALRVTGAPLRVAQAALEGHIDIDPIDLTHLLGAVLENLNAAEKSAGDLALVIGRHRKAVGGEA